MFVQGTRFRRTKSDRECKRCVALERLQESGGTLRGVGDGSSVGFSNQCDCIGWPIHTWGGSVSVMARSGRCFGWSEEAVSQVSTNESWLRQLCRYTPTAEPDRWRGGDGRAHGALRLHATMQS